MKSAAIITAPWLGWKILRELYVPKAFQWYAGLNKPSWRPPVWSFGPVYTFLYPSMGYASHLIWKAGNETFEGKYGNALMFYAGSLALNLSFTPVFFGSKNLTAALCNNIALSGLVAATGFKFYKLVPLAGYLFIPYFCWASMSTALTFCFWRDNSEHIKKEE